MGILAWIVLGLVAGAGEVHHARPTRWRIHRHHRARDRRGSRRGLHWARTSSASAISPGSMSAASRSPSEGRYWCCSSTGSLLAAALDPRSQNTNMAAAPNALLQWTVADRRFPWIRLTEPPRPLSGVVMQETLMNEDYEKGYSQFSKMVGEENIEKLVSRLRLVCPDFEREVVSVVGGRIWTRGGIDLKTRSLCSICVLAALGRNNALKLNLQMALRNGAQVGEICEAMFQVAVYAGFPAAWDALDKLAEVLKEENA